jgi:hypothetical protein
LFEPRPIDDFNFAPPTFAAELPLNPAVTQATIGPTIYKPGWTKRQCARPSRDGSNQAGQASRRRLDRRGTLLVMHVPEMGSEESEVYWQKRSQ